MAKIAKKDPLDDIYNFIAKAQGLTARVENGKFIEPANQKRANATRSSLWFTITNQVRDFMIAIVSPR